MKFCIFNFVFCIEKRLWTKSFAAASALALLGCGFLPSVHAAPAKNANDYYKKLFSLLQVQRYKYDEEIGKTTFTTIEEEAQYKKGLFRGVKITATLETKEMLDAYVESQKGEDFSDEDAENLRKELYGKYRVNERSCFLLLFDNTSNRYNHLELNPLKDNVILQLSSGKEIKPVDYDKEIEGLQQRKISGLVCFPKEDPQREIILSDKIKWIKLKIIRVFPMDATFVFRGPADFDFTFEFAKYRQAVKNGIAAAASANKNKNNKNEINQNTPPTTGEDVIQLGLAAVRQGKLDDAISYFKQAVEKTPDDVSLYILLGSAYLKKDLYDAAISIFRQAVDIDPLSSIAHYHLGVSYREKRDYEKAVVEFKQAVASQENYKEAYFLLGVTYADLNLKDEAKSALEKVLELDSSDARARLVLEKLK